MNLTQFKYILLIVLFIMTMGQYLITHESVHGVIQGYYGCTNTTYGLNSVGAYAKCNSYIDNASDVRFQEKQLHSLNEIYGYYIPILITLVFTMILFYMVHNDFMRLEK